MRPGLAFVRNFNHSWKVAQIIQNYFEVDVIEAFESAENRRKWAVRLGVLGVGTPILVKLGSMVDWHSLVETCSSLLTRY